MEIVEIRLIDWAFLCVLILLNWARTSVKVCMGICMSVYSCMCACIYLYCCWYIVVYTPHHCLCVNAPM